jgi:hypothetical protein
MVRDGLRVWDDPRNSQGMTKWITDRLPTEAVADRDGDVQIPYRVDSDDHRWQHWSLVVLGQPWSSEEARRIIAADADEPTPPEPPAPPIQPEPTFQELRALVDLEHLRAQAELEHLRAKTELLNLQIAAFERSQQRGLGVDLASMSDNKFDDLVADVLNEIYRRRVLEGKG